ncbi:MAG: hypothetical protein ACRDQB_17755 [Thermocrispum sp.]
MSELTAARRIVGVGLSTVALLGLAACGGGQGSARELGETMAEAFADRDADALADLACEADREEAEKMKLEAVLGSALEQDFTVDLVKATENGDTGVVTLKLTVGGRSETEDFDIRKENDAWTICNP